MSSSSWLGKQRKPELTSLAEKVGLEDYASLKKADLEVALDEHLRANQTQLSKDPSLDPFFKYLSGPGPPVKKETSGAITLGEETKKPRARRTTKAKEDIQPTDSSEPEQSKALVSRSPRSSLSFASDVRLPPSPSVVVDQIDQRTANIRSSISRTWERSGVIDFTENLRDKLSTTVSIESLALVVEICGLQKEILPIKYLAMVPASRILGTPEIPAKVPDLFVLLTPSFWSTFLLWLSTSVVLPMIFAYFFNLGLKAKHGQVRHAKNVHPANQYDPLAFNISKALVAWLVYRQELSFGGLVADESIQKIQDNVPGGYQGIMIGAGIGALTSIYEAILKK